MARYALVKDGTVENVVEWDGVSLYETPGYEKIAGPAEIGDTWDGNAFHRVERVTPLPVPGVISDRQFYQQLAVMALITEEDALAAVMVGAIPAQLAALVDAMPAQAQFPARMLLSGAVQFQRHHPLTEALGLAFGYTGEQLDDLWRAAYAL